jgi:hypothetical protein
MVLEHLEAKRLGDHDGDHIPGAEMPPPSNSEVLDASVFILTSSIQPEWA